MAREPHLPSMSETITGVIDRVAFHNADSGFTVLRVEVPGRHGVITVVGNLASAVAGEYVEAAGTWTQDPDHGMQFKAEHLKATPPQSVAGIEKFLGSGLIK